MPPKPPSRIPGRELVDDAEPEAVPVARQPAASLAGLGIAGLSRRRVGIAVTGLVALWIVIGFAGQASAAARAADRAVQEQATNEALAANVASLRDELELVQTQRWILQQARAYGLGSTSERPFEIAADAPSLAPDAPGSPARRLGSAVVQRSPWIPGSTPSSAPGADRESPVPRAPRRGRPGGCARFAAWLGSSVGRASGS